MIANLKTNFLSLDEAPIRRNKADHEEAPRPEGAGAPAPAAVVSSNAEENDFFRISWMEHEEEYEEQ